MSNDNRIQPGVPAGGQFATKQHDDAPVALTAVKQELTVPIITDVKLDASWFDELPEWPENLPQPQASFEFDNGQVETYISAGDVSFKVWQGSDGDKYNTLNDNFGSEQETDWPEEDTEAAVEWAYKVHDRIDGLAYSATLAAVDGEVITAILAAATDKPYTPKVAPIYTAEEMEDDAPKRGVDRAERGMSRWFATKTGDTEDTDDEVLQGVLTDLHHWADKQGIDFDEVFESAERMHRNEVDRPQM